jgi:hypothetical protein
LKNNLPSSFRKYFWDCDFSDLSLEKYPKFIIERILDYGTLKDIKWLKERISEAYFRKIATESRRLGKRTLNYWKTMYSNEY